MPFGSAADRVYQVTPTDSLEVRLVLGLSVVVLESLEPGDQPDATPEDLLRSGVVANIARVPGPVRQVREAVRTGSEAVRDAGAGRSRDDVAGPELVLPVLEAGVQPGRARCRPELEHAAAVEDDEDLL